MKLRNKVLLIFSIVWLLFLAIMYAGTEYFLIRSFLQLEESRGNRDIDRVNEALEQNIIFLQTFTANWGHLNQAYALMQGKNPAFVKNNFAISTFVNSNVNLLLYWNSQRLVTGIAVDTDNKKAVAYPRGLEKYLYPGSKLLSADRVNGVMLLPSGLMLVAACQITDSNEVAPPLGTIIAGRYLSPALLKTIQETTRLNVELIMLAEINQNPELKKIFTRLKNGDGRINILQDKDMLSSYSLIRDVNGNPVAMFHFHTARLAYSAGTHAINYFFTGFIILAILLLTTIIWLLRTLIVNRLERLNNEVTLITDKKMLSRRVTIDERDEITSVAKKINALLTTIEKSHQHLEKSVDERTHELRKTNLKLQQEISERKTAEDELNLHKENISHLANYDALTSLPNRVFFSEILNKAINHAARHKKNLAILMIDLDRFKNINDALGHPTGDLVLREIAHRFATVLRAGDVLARLGGDEFIILLNDIEHPKFASPVAEKLLLACSKPLQINNHEFYLNASIGICIYPDNGATLEDLLKNADMAMYQAKQAGGGIFHYFTDEMNLQAHKYIHLESALRKAISNNEFILYYQPKINLKDNTLEGVEALIRWENPDLGLVSPDAFIPLAEETGLIMQIGEWALREACRVNKSWQDQGYQPISIAVNLSPKQFRHADISQLLTEILLESGLEAKYLELEITETAVMDNVEKAIEKLNTLKQMGIRITVDDFGTGYTSITYLKKFPVSFLKIDQTFIKGIPANQNDMAITNAIIALAHNCGLKVVAEGVENAEQLHYLVGQNCDVVQGYYLSRPLPEQKIVLQFSPKN